MKHNNRKSKHQEFAEIAINDYFHIIESSVYPAYNKLYVDEIVKLASAFNIRLGKRKLEFCKKCHVVWNVKTRQIRFNTKNKTKEYICKECGYVKRFRYN